MLYEKIKALCEKKGISIMECEKRAGLGNGVISGWKTSSPRIDSLRKVAAVLEVPIEELLEE